MVTRVGRRSYGHHVWISVRMVAKDLALRAEDVRITAETYLDANAYDPEQDMITDQGRRQLRDLQPRAAELTDTTLSLTP